MTQLTSRRTSHDSSVRSLRERHRLFAESKGPVRPSVRIQTGPATCWVRAQSNIFAQDSGLIVLCRLSSWAATVGATQDACATQHLLCATASLREPRRAHAVISPEMTTHDASRSRDGLLLRSKPSRSLSACRVDALMLTA